MTFSNFGDYIIYVDESGDHNMQEINPQYPVFVLSFCIFPVDEYVNRIVPAVEKLKFDFFGHDMVVLHEREIRKAQYPFDILINAKVREDFLQRLTSIMSDHRYGVVSAVIRKNEMAGRAREGDNPYHVALEFGLERVFMQLQQRSQRGKKTFVVFESRGKKEDRELELEFRRIMDSTRMQGMASTLFFKCVSKATNSAGLQIADMVARPVGTHILNPEQPNRSWEIIKAHTPTSKTGSMHGYGLKVYP